MRMRTLVLCAGTVALCLLLAPMIDAGSSERFDAPAENRLHQALLDRIGRDDVARIRLDLGAGLSYTVVDADAEGLWVTVAAVSAKTRIPWRWRDLGPEHYYRLYRSIPATQEILLELAAFCFRTGLEDEANDCLRRLIVRQPSAGREVDAFLAELRGEEPPESGYVFFDGRFVTIEERDQHHISFAEAWLIEKQAAEDLAHARAEDLFDKAVLLEKKGFFRAGVNFMRKTAAMAKGRELGITAADRSKENGVLLVQPLTAHGRPENRVDVFILGEGYVLKDKTQTRFLSLCRQLIHFFSQREVFKAYDPYFNFHTVNAWSKEDGVDTPTNDSSTVFGGKWSGFAQGQVAVDLGLVYSSLDLHAPGWDSALVMVRRGGGGTGANRVAAFAHASPGIAFHEFGHSFVGLLDEYSTQVSKKVPVGPPPVGINLTASDRPEDCSWKHWLDRKTPGVGLYLGGGGRSKGVWHPSQSCVMGTGGDDFCIVCREAFVLKTYEYVRPIDELRPKVGLIGIDGETTQPITFSATLMKPLTHSLVAKWSIQGKPVKAERKVLDDGRVRESVTLVPKEMKLVAGYERALTLEVEDPTPWVVNDPRGLMKQKVSWRFRVLTEEEKRQTKRTGK